MSVPQLQHDAQKVMQNCIFQVRLDVWNAIQGHLF